MFLTVLAVLSTLAISSGSQSQCFGTRSDGALRHAKRLPLNGQNYSAYSSIGWLLGRTSMHGKVRDAARGAYAALSNTHPDLTFTYGEASWPWGGRFWPHRTHRNGLSVDFVVPVTDDQGNSVPFPVSMLRGSFYSVEIDNDGRFGSYRIDFPTMARHILALQQSTRKHGIAIDRIIFYPPLQRHLLKSEDGRRAKKQIRFSRNPSWFRHDAHYHVDFVVKCAPLK